MTTTELIELLKKYEKGGVRGRPRDIKINLNDGLHNLYLGEVDINVTGVGDGICTDLLIQLTFLKKKMELYKIQLGEGESYICDTCKHKYTDERIQKEFGEMAVKCMFTTSITPKDLGTNCDLYDKKEDENVKQDI